MTDQIGPPTNALALAGFVLGIIAVCLGATSPNAVAVLILPTVPALLAIIFGFIGVNTANRLGGRRRAFAIWAIVLGFCPIPASLLTTFVLALLGAPRL